MDFAMIISIWGRHGGGGLATLAERFTIGIRLTGRDVCGFRDENLGSQLGTRVTSTARYSDQKSPRAGHGWSQWRWKNAWAGSELATLAVELRADAGLEIELVSAGIPIPAAGWRF